jgi:hypothetical protein
MVAGQAYQLVADTIQIAVNPCNVLMQPRFRPGDNPKQRIPIGNDEHNLDANHAVPAAHCLQVYFPIIFRCRHNPNTKLRQHRTQIKCAPFLENVWILWSMAQLFLAPISH